MAKLIKQIYDLISLATDKGITGYHSDQQIMDVVDQTQMDLFRMLVREFAKTKQIRNELLPFQKRSSVTITSKIGSLPGDFEHEIDCWATVQNVDQPIRIIESGMFRSRLNDPIDVPSTTNLFANIYFDGSKKIEVCAQVTPVVLNYFKRPVKPVYATTVTGGQLIYDDNNSVDVEFTPLVHGLLVERSLLLLGVNMRDGQLQRVGASPIPKEATVA